ncbi:MAG: outer membrane lipoprotein carrier protein LolA [Bacteroidia bacterium]|nr:outer membrane lipoprotein carrier protein LolA [Bacteroidia bacterium]
MKIFKLFTAILTLTLLVSMTTQAQGDPKADKILKESQAKFKSFKDVSATFTYTLSNPNLDKPVIKKGSVKMAGDKYAIEFSEEKFYCNGKTVWVYMVEDNEVTITDADPEEGMSIDRIYSVYEKDTKSRFDGEEGTDYKITLFMLDKNSDFWKAEVLINKTTKLISKATMFGRTGSTYEYKLQDMKTNNGFADGIFIFDPNKYDDIYINDMR